MSTIIFGTMVVIKQISAKDRIERKYMRMWRWVSQVTARMMSRFPTTESRYMHRNNTKKMGYSSGSCISGPMKKK
jgi:hypothetical protein